MEERKPSIHCKYVDGTDNFSCNFRGPYDKTRNKPTLARVAYGPVEQWGGKIKSYHLRCEPAELNYSKRGTEEHKTYAELVKIQSECTHFEEWGS